LVVGAAAWWWYRPRATPPAAPKDIETAEALPTRAAPLRVGQVPPTTAGAPSGPPERLQLKDDRLRARLDENIPDRLYAAAAHCYTGGLKRDQRLDLTYRLHVNDSEVTVSDVKVTANTLDNPALERCIRDRVLKAHWRDEELPDLDEEDDLYMRVAGFQRFLAAAEADAPTANPN
jgi:hypothetical protein